MKKLLIALGLIFHLISCSSDEEVLFTADDLIGKWQLVETLFDPGDGSGVYQSVESDQTITFLSNGTYKSNEDLCNTGSGDNQDKNGVFDIDEMTITPTECSYNYTYRFEGTNLILHPPCIEACGLKYVKISNDIID